MLNQNNFAEMVRIENKISEVKKAIENAETNYPQVAASAAEAGYTNIGNAKVKELKDTLAALENKLKILDGE
jgi:hypothetical protein